MDTKRSSGFADGLVEEVLADLGVEIVSSGKQILGYCPLHPNRDTPSFSIDPDTGLWICFSGQCGRRGNIYQLHMEVTGNPLAPIRAKALDDFEPADLEPLDAPDIPLYPQETIDLLESYFDGSPGEAYLAGRGLPSEICQRFHVGYDPSRKMVTVPVYQHEGLPVGIVGRSIEGKQFRNSKSLPKSKVLYNLHRARRHDSVIVVESSLDVIRLEKAGFTNAVAMLGSSVSKFHADLLNMYFTKMYVFTDNPAVDDAGAELALQLHAAFKRTTMFCQYARPVKDPGDLSDEECRYGVKESLTAFEYML